MGGFFSSLFYSRNTSDDTRDGKTLLSLLLMGKTGHGKSSLGNSLLGCETFKVCSDTRSQTAEVVSGYTKFENCLLKVVDGPGLRDTKLTELEDTQKAILNMSIALTMCSGGVDAFLFVFTYGAKFTEEEISALETLKKIFGQDYLKHTIVVLTYGDQFNEEITFGEWCKKQTGQFKELYQGCNGRCVLFNNMERNETKQIEQREQLIQLVYDLKNRHGCYTADCFIRAASARQKMITDMKQPILKEEIQRQVGILLSQMGKYNKEPNDMLKVNIETRIRNLKNEINTKDKGFENVLKSVEAIERNLHNIDEHHRLNAKMTEEFRNAVMHFNKFVTVDSSGALVIKR